MKAELKDAMKTAMKARDKAAVEAIRGLLSALQYEELEKETEDLSAQDAALVIKRELKKRREELEFAEKAEREETVEKLNAEITLISSFLPQQFNREQLHTIIKSIAAQSENPSIGVIMKELKSTYQGQYDGKEASDVAQQVLSES